MPATVKEFGEYELFETTHHHRVLVLNSRRWFAWVRDHRGDTLIHSYGGQQKAEVLLKGRFFLTELQQDPHYKDMPHLFLQVNGHFQDLLLPDELPDESTPQKRVVPTVDTVPTADFERYLEQQGFPSRSSAPETSREQAPLPNYERLRADRITRMLSLLSTSRLLEIRSYEQRHKGRKTVLRALERELRRTRPPRVFRPAG